MTELTRKENASYEEYEALLIRRDALRKEALKYKVRYINEFGDLVTRVFRSTVACIERKKIITWCQSRRSRDLPLNSADLDVYITSVMEEYYGRLHDMIAENKALKQSEPVSELTFRKIKSLYRKLARRIHPDIHPELAGDQTVQELWERIRSAYSRNDLEELEDAQAVLDHYLREAGYPGGQPEITGIAARISALNREIETILHTDPYRYKYLLMDEDAVREKKEELEAEIQEYENYAEQLDEVIDAFGIRRLRA